MLSTMRWRLGVLQHLGGLDRIIRSQQGQVTMLSMIVPADKQKWNESHISSLSQMIRSVRAFLIPRLSDCPFTKDDGGAPLPRILLVAVNFLKSPESFGEVRFQNYINSLQVNTPLEYKEIELALPSIQLVCLLSLHGCITFRHNGKPKSVPVMTPSIILATLASVGSINLARFEESISTIDPILQEDPSGVYKAMDLSSKKMYCLTTDFIATRCGCSSKHVARLALSLANTEWLKVEDMHDPKSHVGYFLIDAGRAELYRELGCRRAMLNFPDNLPLSVRIRVHVSLVTILVAMVTYLACAMFRIHELSWLVATALMAPLLLISSKVATSAVNNTLSWFIRPKHLPCMDYQNGIPTECRTVLCIPSLLINEDQVKRLTEFIVHNYLAANDPNVCVALLTDFVDGTTGEVSEAEKLLLSQCRSLINDLNSKHGSGISTPFYLLHRNREFSPIQQMWMGKERKRGKIECLNALISQGKNEFSYTVGNISNLLGVRYALVLDDDSCLTGNAAQVLIGTIAHPLNRPTVDESTLSVVRGHGILVPDLRLINKNVSARSNVPVPTKISTISYSITYDFFSQCQFTGKGIYDIRVFSRILHNRLPEERIISHDTMEGAWLRPGFTGRAKIVEGSPSTYIRMCEQQHRWVRGDWQNFLLILSGLVRCKRDKHALAVPVFIWFTVLNQIRISLLPVAFMVLLISSMLLGRSLALQRILVILTLYMVPEYIAFAINLCVLLLTRRLSMVVISPLISGMQKLHVHIAAEIIMAPHAMMFVLDAILRTIYRYAVKKNLLQWTASVYVETVAKRQNVIAAYLWGMPLFCILFAAGLFASGQAATADFLMVSLWLLSPLRMLKGTRSSPA